MNKDPKRELLRHLLATVAFRSRVALKDAPPNFAHFRVAESSRTPAETLAHIGDLIIGSKYLLQGEVVLLRSEPLSWDDEIARFYLAVNDLDSLLDSNATLANPIERMVQGPIGDALTHVGQIIMLRRIFGSPVREAQYFTAEVVPGSFRQG
jgi:hypothetical protein